MENDRVVEIDPWVAELVGEGHGLEDLAQVGLAGLVPAEIGRLSALRTLNLDDNDLTSLPAEILQLTSLECLLLSGQWHEGNLLTLTSLPAEIRQLTSLTCLDISHNPLTTLPVEIWQLTSLRVLVLSGIQLTSLPAEIGQLASLKELYLRGNQLTSLPAEIGQLTSLRVLSL